MSEEIYRLMHYLAVLIWVGGNATLFFGPETQNPKKAKIWVGVASLLILVGGMGLIIRALGLTHGSDSGWPWWIKIKLVLWFILAVASPVLHKRVSSPRKRTHAGIVLMALTFVAVALAVYKPPLL